MARRSAWLAALVALLALSWGQTPPPVQTDPLALSGGIISVSSGVSCDDIFTSTTDGTSDDGTLNCNKATVMVLQVPLVPGGGAANTFQFTANGQSGGGVYHTSSSDCLTKGPGYCLYGQSFDIEVNVSEVATAHDLTYEHIVSPFAYMYENCISKAPATNQAFYPYYADGTCGPADLWDWHDYKTCQDKQSWPYFFNGNKATKYSKCAFMCGWELEKINATLSNGVTLDQWCNDQISPISPGNIVDVVDNYNNAGTNPLACARATEWKGVVNDIMPNFPQPSGFCPCAGSAMTVINDDDTSSPPSPPTPPLGPYSSVIPCKSCAGAGSCGTALPRPAPEAGQEDALCNDTDMDVDTVCECVAGDGNSDGMIDPADDPVNDAATVCFNTEQRHRCLKCQPTLTQSSNDGKNINETCAYTDINKYAMCQSYWIDICGAGDYMLADRQRNIAGQKTSASISLCNCRGVFVERAYWVAPFCAPYRIVNPSRPQYVVTVSLKYSNGPLAGQYVPNGTMTVGSGFSPFFDAGDPPGAANATVGLLSWLNATVDGFAVSEILSEYTKSGGYTTNLEGSIVMCNNGEKPYCGFETTNSDAVDDNVPNANIRTAGNTGIGNPWNDPDSNGELRRYNVPLPDFLYNLTNAGKVENNLAAWWYFLSQEERDTYGLACGQNGWRITGTADTASANTMCNNLQGTCVPGVDRQLRGEAVAAPCTVAVDFLNYVAKYIPRDGDTPAEAAAKKNPPRPPHVPPSWESALPTYTVHRGKLFRYDDPVVSNGRMAIRLRISIAADFAGETVVQAGGSVSATSCDVSTVDGLGSFYVQAVNKGTQPAQYSFSVGPTCTPGLSFEPQIVSIMPGDATADPKTWSTVRLNIRASDMYGTPGVPANAQSCSVIMTPSLSPETILGTTAVIPCVPQYGYPEIAPLKSADVPFTESLADSAVVNLVNGGGCGWLCATWNWGNNSSIMTPFEWMIITFVITVVVFFATILVIIMMGQHVAAVEAQETAYQNAVASRAMELRAGVGIS